MSWRCQAGIDEAGLGPLLGPLAIGYSVFETESDDDHWKLLTRRVAREPNESRGRLVVADSKRVFSRTPQGRKRLEATALTFLALLDENRRPPSDCQTVLFGRLRPDPELLRRHPWYARLPRPPFENEAGALELRAAVLEREMTKQGCRLLDAGVRLVPAGELNASYHETDNKSDTVWHKTRDVLRHVWNEFGERAPALTVDRQGGRAHYGPILGPAFPEAAVTRVAEDPGRSEYEVISRRDGRRMNVVFKERGEEHSFPTALASCLAKYARETVMAAFNAYFRDLQPSLRATAGYTTDGRRWLKEAAPALAAAELLEGVLIRER